MTARFLTTTALVLTLTVPVLASAGQSAGVTQETRVEGSTNAAATTGQSELLADARVQLRSAMSALEEVKDSAADKFAAARENAWAAVGKLEAALESAKAEIAESSRAALVATQARIAEARALIEDQQSKPQEIAGSLGAVSDAAGNVKLNSSQSADAQTAGKADAGAKSDTGLVGKVGSALGLGSDTQADANVSVGTGSWQKVQLVGKTLYGADQEPVGKINDVVMSQSGTVESVLVDVGGFLGIGAKQVAVPVAKVEVQGETLVAAGLSKRQAEQMPAYQRQQ